MVFDCAGEFTSLKTTSKLKKKSENKLEMFELLS